MSHNHKTLITKIAMAAIVSLMGVTALPGLTAHAASTSVVASAPAKTAPGQPKFGESGPAVVAVQNAIIRNGFTLRGGATGNFDARTRSVLRTFQRVVGLKVTGVVDTATARVLKLATTPQDVASSPAPAATTVAAPVSSGPFITKLPKRGSGSKSVVIVQKALIAAGVPVAGGADGIFGAATTRAIASFQKAQNISATGRLDQQTAIALGVMAPPVAVAVAPAPSATPAPAASPASSSSAHVTALPQRGHRSNDVVIVQSALIAAGVVVKGGVDGIFGGATAMAISQFQRQHGFAATGRLDERTALKLGVIAPPAVQLAVFPVQGPCSFSNTWHAPRGDRKHLGVDIIANEGNLIYAVADGTITRVYNAATSKLAGNGVRLTTADGTYFFYGHFQRVADGITVGTQVKAGQVIGYNGKTGNTSTPHLHFEIHPQGGPAIDPTSAVAAVNACHVTAPLPIP
jgi:peptidoglycan hydrolase-like protein with peptidoglycan-binding domain